MAKVVHGFLDEGGKVWILLYGSRKLDMFDESTAHCPIYLFCKFIAIIETFAKCLHLIACARQADNIAIAIMIKVEHKTLQNAVVSDTHLFSIFFAKIHLLFGLEEKRHFFCLLKNG